MKQLFISGLILVIGVFCFGQTTNTTTKNELNMKISESEILKNLDESINGDYNDFIDLGHGYFELANSRLTLFKDGDNWALVFEKFGYNARAGNPVQLEIHYFGNCLINLPEYNGQTSNYDIVEVENNIYQMILSKSDTILIRDQKISIPINEKPYTDLGITWDFDGKIYIGAILKYLAEKQPEITRASDTEISRCIPKNLNKIMTIDSWHQDVYHQFEPNYPPSQQETFQLIAKVLVTGDTKHFKPTKKTNNHWSNWPESGGL